MKHIDKIIHVDQLLHLHPGWEPSSVAFMKAFELADGNLLATFLCQLRSAGKPWPVSSEGFFEVSLRFINVVNLSLSLPNPLLQQLSGFDIVDLSGDGLEEINFHVVDVEQGVIRLFCKSIEVVFHPE